MCKHYCWSTKIVVHNCNTSCLLASWRLGLRTPPDEDEICLREYCDDNTTINVSQNCSRSLFPVTAFLSNTPNLTVLQCHRPRFILLWRKKRARPASNDVISCFSICFISAICKKSSVHVQCVIHILTRHLNHPGRPLTARFHLPHIRSTPSHLKEAVT